jgi:hypothetical protein
VVVEVLERLELVPVLLLLRVVVGVVLEQQPVVEVEEVLVLVLVLLALLVLG